MGCGTGEPGNNHTNPCIGNSCGDVLQSDSHITNNDTDSTTGDNKSADSSSDSTDTTTSTCSDPNTMPSNCKPSEAVNAKCLSGTCDSWFRKDQTCQTDAECQKIPCVCWNFCDFLGIWQPQKGSLIGLLKFEDNETICEIKDPVTNIVYENEKDTKKMVAHTDNSITVELTFVPYCTVDNNIFDCSAKEDCRMDNHCSGSCSGQSCNSDDDCKAIEDFTGCKQSTCTSTGGKCHVVHNTDTDPCPAIYASCQTDNKYLSIKECNDNKCVTTMLQKIY